MEVSRQMAVKEKQAFREEETHSSSILQPKAAVLRDRSFVSKCFNHVSIEVCLETIVRLKKAFCALQISLGSVLV